jgi:hypothetical protein
MPRPPRGISADVLWGNKCEKGNRKKEEYANKKGKPKGKINAKGAEISLKGE